MWSCVHHFPCWPVQQVQVLMQAGELEAALSTYSQLKAVGGGVGAGALRVLGQLARAGVTGGARTPKGLAGLEAQLPSPESLPQSEVDRLEHAVPGGCAACPTPVCHDHLHAGWGSSGLVWAGLPALLAGQLPHFMNEHPSLQGCGMDDGP